MIIYFIVIGIFIIIGFFNSIIGLFFMLIDGIKFLFDYIKGK